MGAGGNRNNQWEWDGNGNKTRLNLGMGMGMGMSVVPIKRKRIVSLSASPLIYSVIFHAGFIALKLSLQTLFFIVIVTHVCLVFFISSFFRTPFSKTTPRNSTKLSHMLGSASDLKMDILNLGVPLTCGPRKCVFSSDFMTTLRLKMRISSERNVLKLLLVTSIVNNTCCQMTSNAAAPFDVCFKLHNSTSATDSDIAPRRVASSVVSNVLDDCNSAQVEDLCALASAAFF